MTLYEFNQLPDEAQLSAVWARSQFVVSRRDGVAYLNLDAIDSFWVKLRYHPGPNQIMGCRAFGSTKVLEPYRSLFSLADLFKADSDSGS